MDRIGSLKRLKENNRGYRRRQSVKPVCKSSGTAQSKSTNKTKKRNRDNTSPEKD